tara:strand:- start:4 stop:552 length:549 start_codon:yes stop_codon:yes gene_type:complete
MKKLLLTLLLPLSIISSTSYGEEINSLFGITLYDNAEKYVSSNYINSNKIKNTETIEGYFDLDISDKIPSESPYFSLYKIVIYNNKIHSIYGHYDYINMDICQAVHKSLLSDLEKKYQIDSDYAETSYPTFKISGNFYFTDSNNYFSLQCKENYEDTSSMLQIMLDSPDFDDAINEFYDSGL